MDYLTISVKNLYSVWGLVKALDDRTADELGMIWKEVA
jgi:hypothetical protein